MQRVAYCEPGRILCRSRKILLAVDGSPGSAKAASVAFEIAELTGSKVFIAHVVPVPAIHQFSVMSDSNPRDILHHYTANGMKLLEGYREAARKYGLDTEIILEKGSVAERLVRIAHENRVDMVVIGSEGASSTRRGGMGSTVERVVMGSECPVIVAK
jgi:nucleotide-binding universal stress UspA family protein